MDEFSKGDLKKLWQPKIDSKGEQNGQITIIGGSKLFHGAPILSLKVASRMVDMVFFATPRKSVGHIAESIKSKLMSFIWVPWSEVGEYINKSDSILIGPGFMRYGKEVGSKKLEVGGHDEEVLRTRKITKRLLTRFPNKSWVIDAGSLQAMKANWIPKKCNSHS